MYKGTEFYTMFREETNKAQNNKRLEKLAKGKKKVKQEPEEDHQEPEAKTELAPDPADKEDSKDAVGPSGLAEDIGEWHAVRCWIKVVANCYCLLF